MITLIFISLITIFSLQAMEKEQPQPSLWVSAKLLHIFLPMHEFKKLGKQLFYGGKDGRSGQIDIMVNNEGYDLSLMNTIHQIFPTELCHYICNFCEADKKQEEQEQDKQDQELIKQTYVNSYAIHQKIPHDKWQKIEGNNRWKIPYNNNHGKTLEVRLEYIPTIKSSLIIQNFQEIPESIAPFITKDVQYWIQKDDIFFIAYKDNSIHYINVPTNILSEVPLMLPFGKSIKSINQLALNSKKNIFLCSVTLGQGSYTTFPYRNHLYAWNYDPTSSTIKKIECPFPKDIYYDSNSSLYYYLSYDYINKTVSFWDFATQKKYIKKEWQQSHQAFNHACFDSDIGIFAVDTERNALILKPRYSYKKIENFIKKMTLYDRILTHAVLKNGVQIRKVQLKSKNSTIKS